MIPRIFSTKVISLLWVRNFYSMKKSRALPNTRKWKCMRRSNNGNKFCSSLHKSSRQVLIMPFPFSDDESEEWQFFLSFFCPKQSFLCLATLQLSLSRSYQSIQFPILNFIASSHNPIPCEEIGNKSSFETTHFNIPPLLLLFYKFSIFLFSFLTHFSFILNFPHNSPQLRRAHSAFGQFCPMPLSNSSFAGPSAHAITNCLFVYNSPKLSIRMLQISPISAYLCISASIPSHSPSGATALFFIDVFLLCLSFCCLIFLFLLLLFLCFSFFVTICPFQLLHK